MGRVVQAERRVQAVAFENDVAYDLANTFHVVTEYGKTVTYRVASSGTTKTIIVASEEQVFAILDDKANKKFFVKKADIATPARGDQITDQNNERWDALDIQEVEQEWEVRCLRAQVVS